MTEQPDERLGLPSASNWHRYELCAGSWQLEQEAKRIGQAAHERSVDATRGELIHAWLAGVPDEDGNEIKLTESEQTTADFLQERAQGEVQRIFGDQQAPYAINEKRLWFELDGRKVLSGRFDRVLYTPTKALCQDFKTGFSEPDPAKQNAQLKVLAVLIGLHLPAVEEVIVQIISGPYGVTEAHYNVAALGRAYHEIMVTLRALHDPQAPFNPSPEACQFCGALNICTAVKNLANPIAKLQISTLPDGTQGAQILDKVEVLQEHLDAIREYYADQLTKDPAYQLPGYMMMPGSEVRTVKDWKTAKVRLAEFLPDEQIEKAGSYGITKIQSALAKQLKLTSALAEAKFNQILDGLIELKQNKSSLKRVGRPKLELAT